MDHEDQRSAGYGSLKWGEAQVGDWFLGIDGVTGAQDKLYFLLNTWLRSNINSANMLQNGFLYDLCLRLWFYGPFKSWGKDIVINCRNIL